MFLHKLLRLFLNFPMVPLEMLMVLPKGMQYYSIGDHAIFFIVCCLDFKTALVAERAIYLFIVLFAHPCLQSTISYQ